MTSNIVCRLSALLIALLFFPGCSLSSLQNSLFPGGSNQQPLEKRPDTQKTATAPPAPVPMKPATVPAVSVAVSSAVTPAAPTSTASAAISPSRDVFSPVKTSPAATSAPLSVPRARQTLAKPPQFAYHGGVLTEDVTWRGDVFVDGSLTIAPQATLSLEPGTTVRFHSNGKQPAILVVQGRISAKGTPDLPVTFTSDYAGAQPGDWQGILLLSSEKNNLLEQCRIEGAETGLSSVFSRVTVKSTVISACRTGAAFDTTYVVLSGGGFRKCAVGLIARNSELDLRETDLSGNGIGLATDSCSISLEKSTLLGNEKEAVVIRGGHFRIYANRIAGNGSGLTLEDAEGGVSVNRITTHGGAGIHISGAKARISGNDISGNGGGGIRMEDGTAAAWGNSISGNGIFDALNEGDGDLVAVGNWWGVTAIDMVPARIGGTGTIRWFPPLQSPPSIDR